MPPTLTKNIFSLASLPLLASFFLAFVPVLLALVTNLKTTFYFLLGLFFYLLVHYKFAKKTGYFYIFSHEMSHALSGLLHGIRIKKISVKKNSGYVVFKGKPNYLTDLAPYFIPFYALAAALLYFSAGYFLEISAYRSFFIFVEGFFIAFHVINTAEIIAGPVQSDFRKAGGFFFSFVFTAALNLLFMALILKMLFPGLVDLSAITKKTGSNLSGTAGFSVRAFKRVYNTAKIYMDKQ
ncbi:MAG: hypothetical protein COT17_04770 [Elusimicrobia bacterium CG08_land_8_20_14_0_20_51_18]|nr:MAG: hypothetical protein COT17_04770 [Elusimicrobia bacterium CG08_land_8_20_14_0_20_51_18]